MDTKMKRVNRRAARSCQTVASSTEKVASGRLGAASPPGLPSSPTTAATETRKATRLTVPDTATSLCGEKGSSA